jgi:hypothetical protein
VVDIWACQNLQVVPEEFLDLQGASITVNNFIIFIIFKLHSDSLSLSLSHTHTHTLYVVIMVFYRAEEANQLLQIPLLKLLFLVLWCL